MGKGNTARIWFAGLLLAWTAGAGAAPVVTGVEILAPAAPAPVSFASSAERAAMAKLLEGGADAAALYRLLAPLEPRYAGDADFDYALGTSALDSDRPGAAIYSLQRAVAARPAFLGARMELARAYYAIGDNESARREFQMLQGEDPPPQAARAIGEYLDAIDRRAGAYRPQRRVTLEFGAGHDSNANGAPATQSFLGFTLDARNQETGSAWYSVGLGGAYSYPFRPRWRMLGKAEYQQRAYGDAAFVDSDALAIMGGLEHRRGHLVFSLAPGAAWSYLGGEHNHRIAGADLDVAWQDDSTRLGVTARYSTLRYAEALVLTLQEVDTVLLGFSSALAWPTRPGLLLTSALTFGRDDPLSAISPFGRDLRGARLGAQLDLGRGLTGFLGFGVLDSDYDGVFFGQARRDEQQSAALGVDWQLPRARGWSLRAQAGYVDNASSVRLYDYDRLDAGLTLRKEFR